VFARALRAVVGLERQLQRIAIVRAIVEVIIVAVVNGDLGIAIIPGAVHRAVAVFAARSETAVVGRIGQSVIMPAGIASIVRLRGLGVGGPGCVAALRGIIVLEASRLREIGAGAGGFLAPLGSGRQRQDRLLGRTPHAETHRSGALRMIGALLYAGRDNRDADLAVERRAEGRAPDAVGFRIDQSADVIGRFVDFEKLHVLAADDRDDHALGAGHRNTVQQRIGNGPLSRLERAVGAFAFARAHHG